MAFVKQCTGTIKKCSKCGGQGVYLVDNKWFCEECDKEKKSKKVNKKKTK